MSEQVSKAKQLARAIQLIEDLDSLVDFDRALDRVDLSGGYIPIALREEAERAATEHLKMRLPILKANLRQRMLQQIAQLHAEASLEVHDLLKHEMPSAAASDETAEAVRQALRKANGEVEPGWADDDEKALFQSETRTMADDEQVQIGDIFVRYDGCRHRVTSTKGLTVAETRKAASHIVAVLRPVVKFELRDGSIVDAEFEVCQAESSEQPVQHELPDDAVITPGDVLHGDTWISTVGGFHPLIGWHVGKAKEKAETRILRVTRPELPPAEAMARQIELNPNLLDTIADRLNEEIVDGDDVLPTRVNVAQLMNDVKQATPETAKFEVRSGAACECGAPMKDEPHTCNRFAKAEPVLEQSCCAECDSRKAQSVEELRVQSQNETDKPCADCAGTGYYHGPRLGDEACPKCKGSGLFTKSVSSTSENANENKGGADQRPTFVDAEEDAFGNPPMSDELPQPMVSIGKNHAGKTLKEVLDSFRISPELAAKLTEDQCDIVLPKLPEGMTWQEFAASFSDADMTAVREAIRRESMQETNDRFAEDVLKLSEVWRDTLGSLVREAWNEWARRSPSFAGIELPCYDSPNADESSREADRCIGEALWRHFRSVRDEEMAKLTELAERAWGVLASVDFGDWSKQSPIWQEEAEKFRKAFYELIGSKKGSVA